MATPIPAERPSRLSLGAPARRRRAILMTVGVVLALGVTAVGSRYHRQIWSYLTHWRGGPTETWPWQPLEAEPLLRIAAIGDVGDGSAQFHETTAMMYEVSRGDPYDIVYLLGDNIYPKGDPDDLEDHILEPLRAVLDTGAELRAILGNHDRMSARWEEQLDRLGMPGPWHAVTRDDALLVGLDSEDHDPTQLEWLEKTLANATVPWKIVAIHRPPYSSGYQGSDEDVRAMYVPILERHGVQLVLSGHDHDYQRTKPMDGVTYVVSGGGSSARRTAERDFTAVAYAVQHFTDIAVYPDRLLIRAISSEGRVFDEVFVARDGEVRDARP